ncbi:barstar family protein [Paenibacillus sp. R14(2021)]|uniref:barstar family protein n=1 Tax=Paenibacillus sp. R14(2021) TaxID=2859228 RepID=UPI001C61650E|nr:barstar family protein [Paenibacillus sp. R14(2021)]
MKYGYAIVDDESDVTIGYCKDVEGLMGDLLASNINSGYRRIRLIDLSYSNEVMKLIPFSFYNVRITILSRNGRSMGSYYFTLKKQLELKKDDFDFKPVIELTGILHETALPHAMDYWEMLRGDSIQEEYGQWIYLDEDEKRSWLQVIRLHHPYRHVNQSNETDNKIVKIEGAHINDIPSVFIALGEAINGPFGYYGYDLRSFEDCLCGGFGIKPPFTVEWSNFNESFKESNQLDNSSVIMELIKILTLSGVTVLLTK